MQESNVYDITIIGGGPAGLFTAFYAGLRQASTKIIESLPQLGGQLKALYPDKNVYDVAGIKEISGAGLVDNLIEQMEQFQPTICLNETVTNVVKKGQVFHIETNRNEHLSKTIIITAGKGAFEPRRLNVAGEEKYRDKNIHYEITNIEQFHQKEVVILGGGDSAVDWALSLQPIAKRVTIIHRRDRFRAHEANVAKMKQSSISILTPYVPVQLIGEHRLEEIMIQHTQTKETIRVEADEFIVSYGYLSQLGPILDWGLEVERHSIVVNSKTETNIPGIFAVGDITTYPGKVKLMATGFGEAPIAVASALTYIDPTVQKEAPYSTTIMERRIRLNQSEVQ